MAFRGSVLTHRSCGTSCKRLPRRTSARCRRRAPSVDFFVAAIVHYALLGLVAGIVAVITGGVGSALVAAGCVVLVPVSYRAAVSNVGEWRAAVQALVNLGRVTLPDAIGLRQELSFEAERRMWEGYAGIVTYGTEGFDLGYLNSRRALPRSPYRP